MIASSITGEWHDCRFCDKHDSVNCLYFGDNLEWLRDRREFPDASVYLV